MTDEIKNVKSATTVQDEGQKTSEYVKSNDLWKWGLGILACLFVVVLLKSENAGTGYAVPANVETPSEILKRLDAAVPASIEEAREMAYENARGSWSDNKAGPPSDAEVAFAIQMVDDQAATHGDFADPKARLIEYNIAVAVAHCFNPNTCGYK